jgi:hypothetical protein
MLGAIVGCALAAALLVRLIQVQIEPGGAGLGFALAYGTLLALPFVAAFLARNLPPGPRGGVWVLAGLSSLAVGFVTASFVALAILLIPALLLIAGGLVSINAEGRAG